MEVDFNVWKNTVAYKDYSIEIRRITVAIEKNRNKMRRWPTFLGILIFTFGFLSSVYFSTSNSNHTGLMVCMMITGFFGLIYTSVLQFWVGKVGRLRWDYKRLSGHTSYLLADPQFRQKEEFRNGTWKRNLTVFNYWPSVWDVIYIALHVIYHICLISASVYFCIMKYRISTTSGGGFEIHIIYSTFNLIFYSVALNRVIRNLATLIKVNVTVNRAIAEVSDQA